MGYCGEDCKKCNCYVATINDDDNLRVVTAAMWTNLYGHEFKKEDINCLGCEGDEGVKCGFCSMCEVRACAIEKKFNSCDQCPDNPCEKLAKLGKIDENRASQA